MVGKNNGGKIVKTVKEGLLVPPKNHSWKALKKYLFLLFFFTTFKKSKEPFFYYKEPKMELLKIKVLQ